MLPRSPGVIRRHHLPAGHIGYFSADETTTRRRMRKVCVLDKAQNKTFWSLAQNVGCAKRIYGFGKEWDWDRYLSGAEPFIHEPVDRLMKDGPDHFKLSDWARLAWYVTLLFARGPDLEYEIEQRAAETGMDVRRVSPGYVINAQRIGSAVVRARWSFMWSNDRDLVLGDRGISGMYLQRVQAFGYLIPLRRNFGVVITAGPHPKQVRWSGRDWEIQIGASIAAGNRPNMWTWLASRKQTYGRAPEVLTELRLEALTTIPEQLHFIAPLYQGAQLLGGTQQERRKDELVLLNMLAGISPPAHGEPDEFSL